MSERLDKLQKAIDAGELEPWVGAIAGAWLRSDKGQAGASPAAEDIGALLVDPAVREQLEREAPDGPWDILGKQASSVESHGHVGDALKAISDAL